MVPPTLVIPHCHQLEGNFHLPLPPCSPSTPAQAPGWVGRELRKFPFQEQEVTSRAGSMKTKLNTAKWEAYLGLLSPSFNPQSGHLHLPLQVQSFPQFSSPPSLIPHATHPTRESEGPADSRVVQSAAQMWLGLWPAAAASVITQGLWPSFHPVLYSSNIPVLVPDKPHPSHSPPAHPKNS